VSESRYPEYMYFMYDKIDEIVPGASTKINQIPSLPIDLGIKVLSMAELDLKKKKDYSAEDVIVIRNIYAMLC
jgi:hypothetical protein